MKAIVTLMKCLCLAFAFGWTGFIFAADQPADPLSRFVWQMFQMHQGKSVCSVGDTDLSTIRANVAEYLRASGAGETPSPQVVASAVWTLYPCPFSPYRSELQPASVEDIRGVWLFPEMAQPLRHGWHVSLPKEPVPTKCEVVGYYADGELRTAKFGGAPDCPYGRAKDLDAARARPKVSTWKVISPGRISIIRTDVSGHIEEWEIYIVTSPFQVYEFAFEKGDLVQYMRREKGNDVNAATQFRHLKRLPE